MTDAQKAKDSASLMGHKYAARKYAARVCIVCGEEYLPTGGKQKWCIKCSPIMQRLRIDKWEKDNPERYRLGNARWQAKWRRDHPEARRLADRKCKDMHPERVKIAGLKCAAKRRVLGYVPLNRPFLNCEGHHINQSDVIYIPKEMHMSVRHNVFTGKNMEQINALALSFMGGGNA